MGADWIYKPSGTNIYAIVTVIRNDSYATFEYLDSDSNLYKCFGNTYNGVFSPWFKVATNIQPNFVSGTFKNGWIGTLYYMKNNLKQVTISFYGRPGTVSNYTIITTLPANYLPMNTRVAFPLISFNTGTVNMAYLKGDTGDLCIAKDAGFVAENDYYGSITYYSDK